MNRFFFALVFFLAFIVPAVMVILTANMLVGNTLAGGGHLMLWLDDDPPTWKWEHDPNYVPRRTLQAARRSNFAWWQFDLHCRWAPNRPIWPV